MINRPGSTNAGEYPDSYSAGGPRRWMIAAPKERLHCRQILPRQQLQPPQPQSRYPIPRVVGILLLPLGGIVRRVQKVGETTDGDIEGRVRTISIHRRRPNRHTIVRDMGAALMLREVVRNATGLQEEGPPWLSSIEATERTTDLNLFIGDLEARDTPSHPILQGIQEQEVVPIVIRHMTIVWNTIGVIRSIPLVGLPMMNE
jgi:hypothetical protein